MKLQYKIFLLILTFLLLTCTKNPVDTKALTLQGTVTFAGQQDHSGVVVALYDTTAIDTSLTRYKRQYPNVGAILNQAFYFDHWTQEPVYRTETDKNGHFKLENIEGKDYNLVASKSGFGWKTITNLHGSDAQAIDIKLMEEIKIQENITDYALWEADRHYIITKDITLAENATLIIDRGAVIRFGPFASLIVNGDLEVNGDENNAVIFTADGRDPQAGFWRGIKISGINAKATLNFAKIENAQYGLSCKNAGGDIGNCLIKNDDFGIYCTHESNVNVNKSTLAGNATNIHVEGLSKAHIDGNILLGDNEPQREDIGIYTNNSYTRAENNICTNLNKGIKIEYNGDVEIQKNLFDGHECDVTIYKTGKARIEKNTFLGAKKPQISMSNSIATINRNNFFNTLQDIVLYLSGHASGDIDAKNNYWDVASVEAAQRRIQDKRVDSNNNPTNYKVNIEPIALQKFADAYPE